MRVDYDGFARTLKAHDDALVKDVMYCVKDDKAVFFCPVVRKEDRERVRQALYRRWRRSIRREQGALRGTHRICLRRGFVLPGLHEPRQ